MTDEKFEEYIIMKNGDKKYSDSKFLQVRKELIKDRITDEGNNLGIKKEEI